MDQQKINHIFDLVLDYFEDQSKFHHWLEVKNPVFDNERPIDLIAHGREDRVLKVLDKTELSMG